MRSTTCQRRIAKGKERATMVEQGRKGRDESLGGKGEFEWHQSHRRGGEEVSGNYHRLEPEGEKPEGGASTVKRT